MENTQDMANSFNTKYGTLTIEFDKDFDLETLVKHRLDGLKDLHENGPLHTSDSAVKKRQLEREERMLRGTFKTAPDPVERLYRDAQTWGMADHVGEQAKKDLFEIWKVVRLVLMESDLEGAPPIDHPNAAKAFYMLWVMCEEAPQHNRVLLPDDPDYEKYLDEKDEDFEAIYLLNHVPNCLHPWDYSWGDVVFNIERPDGSVVGGAAPCDYLPESANG